MCVGGGGDKNHVTGQGSIERGEDLDSLSDKKSLQIICFFLPRICC